MYLVSPLGTVLEECVYDPWGRRRNAATWLAYSGTAATARGFTGHEHIDLFELVNMDGRVYDPRLGRFLSPDIYVQDPTHSQSLNRYSYCVNNPLKYTDPSGKLFKEIFGLIAVPLHLFTFVTDCFLEGPIRAWERYKSDIRRWWDAGTELDDIIFGRKDRTKQLLTSQPRFKGTFNIDIKGYTYTYYV